MSVVKKRRFPSIDDFNSSKPGMKRVEFNAFLRDGWNKEWIFQFTNCRILKNHDLAEGDLFIQHGVILEPKSLFYGNKTKADFRVDCGGSILSYGFIDLQINGAFGVDFSDLTKDISAGVKGVAQKLLSHGVVAFCPTIVTSPPSVYRKLRNLTELKTRGGIEGAAVLGFHLEGPFISPQKKGAHPIEYILPISNGRITAQEIFGSKLSNVAIVTLAPELSGSLDAIEWLSGEGVLVSLGHSMASLTEAEAAVNSGARLITHLFNAMPPFHHRDPGLVGLLASSKLAPGSNAYFGIISDGIHTHPAAIRIAYRADFDGLVLVTDAVPAMGLDDGEYEMGSLHLVIKGERATVKGTETLAGSIASLDMCVRRFLKSARCSVVEALEAASRHPAEALRQYPRMGTLEPSSQADFVALSDDLDVLCTFIEGRCVYQSPSVSEFIVYDLRD